MGMYHRVTLMEINGLLDIPTAGLIYIYKLTFKHTGHFYIGQTASIKDRMYQHHTGLLKLLEGEKCVPQKFHTVVAEKIKALYQKDKRVKLERLIRESLSVYVMALVADKETASIVERHYINKDRKNKLCLNAM